MPDTELLNRNAVLDAVNEQAKQCGPRLGMEDQQRLAAPRGIKTLQGQITRAAAPKLTQKLVNPDVTYVEITRRVDRLSMVGGSVLARGVEVLHPETDGVHHAVARPRIAARCGAW